MRNLALAAVLLVVGAAPAGAHHTTATALVAATPYRLGAAAFGPLPRLELGLAWQLHVFDRLLEAGEARSARDLGAVDVHMMSVAVAVALQGGTRVDLALPFGLVDVTAHGADTRSTWGLADIHLSLSQQLAPAAGGLSVVLRAGLGAPTGRYAPDDVLSVTRLRPGTDGSLGLATYNTNASLGRGAWTATAGLELGWSLGSGIRVEVEALAQLPLVDTRDAVRWGADIEGRAGACFELIGDVFGACPALVLRHHARDEVEDLDEGSGELLRRRVGGRDEVALRLALDLRAGDRVGCTLSGEVPVYQRAGGLQLVESVSFRVGCRFLTSLAD
jgi:hypothetical protein